MTPLGQYANFLPRTTNIQVTNIYSNYNIQLLMMRAAPLQSSRRATEPRCRQRQPRSPVAATERARQAAR